MVLLPARDHPPYPIPLNGKRLFRRRPPEVPCYRSRPGLPYSLMAALHKDIPLET